MTGKKIYRWISMRNRETGVDWKKREVSSAFPFSSGLASIFPGIFIDISPPIKFINKTQYYLGKKREKVQITPINFWGKCLFDLVLRPKYQFYPIFSSLLIWPCFSKLKLPSDLVSTQSLGLHLEKNKFRTPERPKYPQFLINHPNPHLLIQSDQSQLSSLVA